MANPPIDPNLVLKLLGSLTLSRGQWAGQNLEILPFQRNLTHSVFERYEACETCGQDVGALDAPCHDGKTTLRRKWQEAYIHMARKNTKTTTTAGWALALMLEEPGGEVLGVAAKREQASLMLDAAKRFVRNSSFMGAPLEDYFTIRRNAIYCPELDSVYKVISSDAQSEHGANPHAVLADELHAWKDPELYYAMVTAMAARANPLTIGITTPGEQPKGLWYDLYEKGQRFRKGECEDDKFFAAIYEAEPDCDIRDREAWKAANPTLGKVVTEEFLERQANVLPEYVFRRLHLAQPTTAHDRWLPLTDWVACDAAPDIPDDAEVYIGLDAAISRDTFGVVIVYVDDEGDVHVKPRAFRPDSVGGYIDPKEVENYILGLANRYRIQEVCYDPAFMQLLRRNLEDRGVPMEALPQTGTNMTRAAETLQRLVLDHRLRHGGHNALSSQMANVGTRPTSDDRGVRISKGKSGGPVDLAVALAMGVDAAFGHEAADESHFFFVV